MNLAVDPLCLVPSLLVLSPEWNILVGGTFSPSCNVTLTLLLPSTVQRICWGACCLHRSGDEACILASLVTALCRSSLPRELHSASAAGSWLGTAGYKEIRLCGRETPATFFSCSANRVMAGERCAAHKKGCRLAGRLCGLCRRPFYIQHADQVHVPPACSRRAGRSNGKHFKLLD